MFICAFCRTLFKVWLLLSILAFTISLELNINILIVPIIFIAFIFGSLRNLNSLLVATVIASATFLVELSTDNLYLIYSPIFFAAIIFFTHRTKRIPAWIISTLFMVAWVYLAFRTKM